MRYIHLIPQYVQEEEKLTKAQINLAYAVFNANEHYKQRRSHEDRPRATFSSRLTSFYKKILLLIQCRDTCAHFC